MGEKEKRRERGEEREEEGRIGWSKNDHAVCDTDRRITRIVP